MNKKYYKMAMLRDREEKPNRERVVNNYYYDNYEPIQNRFSDRRGREHYDNGRYARMDDRQWTITEDAYYPEMRYGGAYSSGGYDYTPMGEEYGYKRVMGFGDHDMPQRNEMQNRTSAMERGHGASNGYAKLTHQQAHEFVSKMKNGDGSTGEHWSMEQTNNLMEQKGLKCDPIEFYVALNMMYSDYYKVAKKMNVNNADFYSCMAEAFLTDPDAGAGKMAKYIDIVR